VRVSDAGFVLALILSLSAGVEAQPVPVSSNLTVHLDAMRDQVSLHSGDATVGAIGAGGFSVAGGVRSRRHLGAEVWLAHSGRHPDPTMLTPEVDVYAIWATVAPFSEPVRGLDLSIAVGAAVTSVSGWPDFSSCLIQFGCFSEGLPGFFNGSSTSPSVGAIASWTVRRFRVRADYRWVASSGVSPRAISRLGVGVGWSLPDWWS
jgi:hypothetical protein